MVAAGEHYTRGQNGRDYVVIRVRTGGDGVTHVWLSATEGGNIDSATAGVILLESDVKPPQWTKV